MGNTLLTTLVPFWSFQLLMAFKRLFQALTRLLRYSLSLQCPNNISRLSSRWLIMTPSSPSCQATVLFVFRWFKFTLKPPYSGASERSLLAIWDTSHWNFFVKFGLRTAWDISYDILLSLLKFVNFWWLQGRLSILAKIGCLQKIKVFSMKEQRGFNVTWGF